MSRESVWSASLLFVLVLFFSTNVPGAASDERLEVRASETQQLRVLLFNQKVDAVLSDGTRIRGRVKDVETGMVVINVSHSTGTSSFPRGEQRIATERFSTFDVSSFKGKKRGILAAALGGVGLLVELAIGSAEIDSLGGEGEINGAGTAVIAATTAGGIAAGYSLGRHLDKKRVTVVIVK